MRSVGQCGTVVESAKFKTGALTNVCASLRPSKYQPTHKLHQSRFDGISFKYGFPPISNNPILVTSAYCTNEDAFLVSLYAFFFLIKLREYRRLTFSYHRFCCHASTQDAAAHLHLFLNLFRPEHDAEWIF